MGIDFGYLKDFKYRYPNRKLYSLMDKIYNKETLIESWKTVYRNKGCAGIDKITVFEFKANIEKYIHELHRELKTGRYNPKPVLRRHIPKQNGKLRALGIPTVKDRIVQQAVKFVLD